MYITVHTSGYRGDNHVRVVTGKITARASMLAHNDHVDKSRCINHTGTLKPNDEITSTLTRMHIDYFAKAVAQMSFKLLSLNMNRAY